MRKERKGGRERGRREREREGEGGKGKRVRERERIEGFLSSHVFLHLCQLSSTCESSSGHTGILYAHKHSHAISLQHCM